MMKEHCEQIIAMINGLFCVLWRSIVVTGAVYLNKADRNFINKHMRKGSCFLLKAVKANFSMSTVTNFEIKENQPIIYMSNHLSLADVPLIMATLPGTIRFVMMQELEKIPIFGKVLKLTENLSVDQINPERTACFYEKGKKLLQSNVKLWIFPEGERSATGKLMPFKLGGFKLARELDAQIVPVGIIGTNTILKIGSLKPKLRQKIKIQIGQPINCRDYKKIEQQKQLVARVLSEIEKLTVL